jgi:hypothetical protein
MTAPDYTMIGGKLFAFADLVRSAQAATAVRDELVARGDHGISLKLEQQLADALAVTSVSVRVTA